MRDLTLITIFINHTLYIDYFLFSQYGIWILQIFSLILRNHAITKKLKVQISSSPFPLGYPKQRCLQQTQYLIYHSY
jgi:hypothetical protein